MRVNDPNIQYLKKIWKKSSNILESGNWYNANNYIKDFLNDKTPVSVLRTLLDTTQIYRDKIEIEESRQKLINLIESKIGKIY